IDALNQLLPDVVDAPTLTPHELNMKAIEDNAETITRMILSQESYDNISGYFETLLIDDDNSSVIRAVIIKYYQYLIFGEDDFSNTPQLSQ
ncbi:hypothetical protein ACKI2C_49420, partial [Streptomyces brasiliscabiei]|uniref:hypothetical protein n=1 Tax=Streptomyces brasiliscabiei TaxID=2736302 RepID=UPI0038F5F966